MILGKNPMLTLMAFLIRLLIGMIAIEMLLKFTINGRLHHTSLFD
jgi:hypothetical protein